MSAERAALVADLVKLRYDHFGVDNWPKAIATIQRAIAALSQPAPVVESEMTDEEINGVYSAAFFGHGIEIDAELILALRAVIAAAFAKRNESTREAVIEECAKVAETLFHIAPNTCPDYRKNTISHGCIASAAAIRALSTGAKS